MLQNLRRLRPIIPHVSATRMQQSHKHGTARCLILTGKSDQYVMLEYDFCRKMMEIMTVNTGVIARTTW